MSSLRTRKCILLKDLRKIGRDEEGTSIGCEENREKFSVVKAERASVLAGRLERHLLPSSVNWGRGPVGDDNPNATLPHLSLTRNQKPVMKIHKGRGDMAQGQQEKQNKNTAQLCHSVTTYVSLSELPFPHL